MMVGLQLYLSRTFVGRAIQAVAQQLAQAAKAQLPNDPTINDTLGWVYVKRDMLQLAKQDTDKWAKEIQRAHIKVD